MPVDHNNKQDSRESRAAPFDKSRPKLTGPTSLPESIKSQGSDTTDEPAADREISFEFRDSLWDQDLVETTGILAHHHTLDTASLHRSPRSDTFQDTPTLRSSLTGSSVASTSSSPVKGLRRGFQDLSIPKFSTSKKAKKESKEKEPAKKTKETPPSSPSTKPLRLNLKDLEGPQLGLEDNAACVWVQNMIEQDQQTETLPPIDEASLGLGNSSLFGPPKTTSRGNGPRLLGSVSMEVFKHNRLSSSTKSDDTVRQPASRCTATPSPGFSHVPPSRGLLRRWVSTNPSNSKNTRPQIRNSSTMGGGTRRASTTSTSSSEYDYPKINVRSVNKVATVTGMARSMARDLGDVDFSSKSHAAKSRRPKSPGWKKASTLSPLKRSRASSDLPVHVPGPQNDAPSTANADFPSGMEFAYEIGPARSGTSYFAFQGTGMRPRNFSPPEMRRVKVSSNVEKNIMNKPKVSAYYFDYHAPTASAASAGYWNSDNLLMSQDAASSGSEKSVFLSPAKPQDGDTWFRVRVDDYNADEKRREDALCWDIPEHLPNSPLCPLNPKHKSGGKGVCPYHSRRNTS